MGEYYAYSQKDPAADSNLCCCEYINRENQQYHIIASCCNCEHFDKVFTECLTGSPVDKSSLRNMLLTFQDRLRIPWRGGAKQVTFGSIVPIFVLPLLISLAAINAYTFTVIFLACTVIMCYIFSYVRQRSLRTRFFNMWILSSLVYLLLLFEITVPLLEVLPEENCALTALTLISLICFYQAYKRASFNHVGQNTDTESGTANSNEETNSNESTIQTVLLLDEEEENAQPSGAANDQTNICSICRKYVQARAAHCKVCSACIQRYDHHSYWLNCCIGESNHRFYVAGLVFAILALLLGADLTLTAVCHPFLAANILGIQILLPDDCSEVFDMYEIEHGLLPEYLEELLRRNSDVHQYVTRQANQFHLQPVRTSKGLKSVFNNGIAVYNNVPDEIKQERTIGLFREKIGRWLDANVMADE